MAGVTNEDTPLIPQTYSLKEVRKGTIFGSVFNLMNTCVGAGTLSVAYAFSQGGLAFSTVTFIIIIVCSLLAALQMVDAKRLVDEMLGSGRSRIKVKIDSFPTLGEAAFGAPGKIATVLVIAILLYLSIISYMIYARDQITKILMLIIEEAQHQSCIRNSVWFSSVFVMSITFLPFFPVYLLRKLSALKYFSFFSILCIVFLLACVVEEFIRNLVVNTGNVSTMVSTLSNTSTSINWLPSGSSPGNQLRNAITCLTYLSLTLVCHFNILPLERELKNPTRKRITLVNLLAMLTAFGLYMIVGVFGYLSFPSNIQTDLTLNYTTTNYLMAVARGGLFFAILFSTPVLFHPTRESINILIGYVCGLGRGCGNTLNSVNGDSTSSQGVHKLQVDHKGKRSSWVRVAWLCETITLFGATFLPACYIPQVNYVWNFVGSIGGFLIVYIMPPLYYLRIRQCYLKFTATSDQSILSHWFYWQSWKSKIKDILAVIILVFGVLAMIASNVQAVLVAIESQSSPNSTKPCYYLYHLLNSSAVNHTAVF